MSKRSKGATSLQETLLTSADFKKSLLDIIDKSKNKEDAMLSDMPKSSQEYLDQISTNISTESKTN